MSELRTKMQETKLRKRAQRRAAKAKIAAMTKTELKKFRKNQVRVVEKVPAPVKK